MTRLAYITAALAVVAAAVLCAGWLGAPRLAEMIEEGRADG